MKHLRPYQQRAIDFLYERNEALLFVPMGAGKTVIVATALQELIHEGFIERALIIAPKRVAAKTWPDEYAEWEHLKNLGIAVGSASHRVAVVHDDAPVVVTNYENLPWLIENNYHKKFDAVVFDEITRMKKPGSKRVKAFLKQLKGFNMRWGMTGTPTTQGLQDLFAQVKCIDGGRALGKTKTGFMNTYFDKYGPEQWMWRPKSDALDSALDAMHHLVFQIDDSEYENELPLIVNNIIKVPLDTINRTTYEEMEKEFILDDIVAVNGGVKVNKLQQIANGFIYDANKKPRWLHAGKLDALQEVIDSQQGAPLLVVYKYQAELEQMTARWDGPVLGSNVSDRDAGLIIDRWNAGKTPILFVHPASAGHGLNLQKGGNTICWYGHTWSAEEHDQVIARLRRSGQTADKVFCHYIVTTNTVDEDIGKARAAKVDVMEAVLDGIKRRKNAK